MARPPGSSDLAIAAGALAVAALVAALAPGWSVLAVTLGIVALVLACASIVLPRRATRAGAVVALIAVGALSLGLVRLTPPDPAATSASVPPQDPPTSDSPAAPPASTAEGPTTGPSTADPTDPAATVVTYEIATDGMSVTHLSYVDLVDGRPTMLEKLGVPPPFRHAVTVPPGSGVDLTDLSVTGMGGASSRRTTCVVTVDGRTVARTFADGAYGLVTCAVPSP